MKMTVIVVRRDDNFSQTLREAGIEVVNLELVSTEVLEDLSEFENLISQLDDYDGVFITSPVAAKMFIDRVRQPVRRQLYALGKRAASVLEDAGFEVKKVPHANTAEEMLAGFDNEEFAGKKLLFVRGERSMRTIPETLAGIAKVDEVAVYRTIEKDPEDAPASDVRRRLAGGEIEWLCFFSPSAVEAFEKGFGSADITVATIGETTATRARELGFRVDLVAQTATNEIFANELIERVQRKQIG